jgi:hypothetical protein
LRIFDEGERLPAALGYMKTNEFSQVIVVTEGLYRILSTEGIAHWLESEDNVVSLSEISLGSVLSYEPTDTCKYLKVDDTVDDAYQVFTKDLGKRVFSILVTKTGLPAEEPTTIITPWDFVAGKLR